MKSVGRHITKPNMKLIKEDVCTGCKQDIKIFEMEVIGGPDKGKKINVPYGCKCAEKEIAERAIEAKKRHKEKKRKNVFDENSLIHNDLKEKTLQDYKPANKSQSYAKQEVITYIKEFHPEKPTNLSLHGGYGVGKSHLAKVITDGVINKGYEAIFITVPKLMRKIRASYDANNPTNEEDIFQRLETIDLLVLDDIGAERLTEWARERLFDLIDSRQGMSTVYTSNYSPKDLLRIYEERDYSRMMFNIKEQIEIIGDNYRLKTEKDV